MQGFNKYYAPDYKPEDGSLNKVHGKHALGDRARKLDQGILIVRFELPYNIWCGGCDNHIGMGVRYNAEKKKVGMYYSTPIFSFRCKCHLCSSWFDIRTDPQNTRYVVHSGARAQQTEDLQAAADGGRIIVEDAPLEEPDAFASLEKTTKQKVKAVSAAAHLDALEDLQSSRWSDPYAASVALRTAFRAAKKVRLVSEGKAEKIRDKYALGDRVRMEDVRTPAREVLVEESAEWEAAKVERGRRLEISEGKRRRDEQQVGWRDAGPSSASTSSRSTGSSSKPRERIASSSKAKSSSSSSSLSTKRPLPARSKHASALRAESLTSRIILNSALKVDPFRLGSDSPSQKSKSVLEGVNIVRRGS